MSSGRPDREDVSAQEAALAAARDGMQEAAEHLADVSRREAGAGPDPLHHVASEATALARVLRSRARRPPAADTAPLAGAVSAAQRAAARSDTWDAAVAAAREAESALDVAAVDLAAARGEDV
ncbi:hypothetical protein [Pseudokineococcus sp. 1T1Z-3]|uniref:hypothetical protein n=1 Tax=Pseudokineococcus sp. 1T1Z-3 TaxID=3132745 RepID=UPI0030A875DE